MPTLREIGKHLFMSHQNAARTMKKLGIQDYYQYLDLDEIFRLYVANLRRNAEEREEYSRVRTRRLQVENELLQLRIDKMAANLVDVDELIPVLQVVVDGCKEIFHKRLVQLKEMLDETYHIDIKMALLEELSEDVFSDLEYYIEQHSESSDKIN